MTNPYLIGQVLARARGKMGSGGSSGYNTIITQGGRNVYGGHFYTRPIQETSGGGIAPPHPTGGGGYTGGLSPGHGGDSGGSSGSHPHPT